MWKWSLRFPLSCFSGCAGVYGGGGGVGGWGAGDAAVASEFVNEII